MFQERTHLKTFRLNQILNGRLSAIIYFHMTDLVNRARWLDHYYKTKCEVSVVDAPWKFLALWNSKWLTIGHYLPQQALYRINRARCLDHYYKTKCEVS